jgi:superfamily I DNA/RNA helicase
MPTHPYPLWPLFNCSVVAAFGCSLTVEAWEPEEAEEEGEATAADGVATVRLTSFEGSKGMSAQRVFILGLHEGGLPYNAAKIKSIEVRRMIVALTRTRRQCYLLLSTSSFVRGRRLTRGRSVFVEWIRGSRKKTVKVGAAYWRRDS